MSPVVSYLKALGIAEEITYNLFVDPTDWLMIKGDLDFDQTIQKIKTDHLRLSPIAKGAESTGGVKSWKGKASGSMAVSGSGFGKLLKQLCGKVVTSVTGGGNYRHIYTPYAGQFPGLSFCQVIGPSQQKNCAGGRVASLKLGSSVGNYMVGDWEFEGGEYSEAQAVASPSAPAAPAYFTFEQIEFTLGALDTELSGLDLTVKRKLASDEASSYKFGSADRIALDQLEMEVAGTLHRRLALDGAVNPFTTQFMEAYANDTILLMVATLTGGEIGSSGENYQATFTTRGKVDQPKRSQPGGVLLEEIPFTVCMDEASEALTIEIVDDNPEPASATGSY